MNPFDNKQDRRERESFAPIEALIRSAGNYVRPSDDLRPRTLEAARRMRGMRRWNKQFAAAAAAVVLLAVFNIPGRFVPTDVAAKTSEATVMREFELRQKSAKSAGLAFNPAWAWFEAFWELRNQQAERIRD
jgi:ferric-dicitrate binding protein FerR (iron transport regulator)